MKNITLVFIGIILFVTGFQIGQLNHISLGTVTITGNGLPTGGFMKFMPCNRSEFQINSTTTTYAISCQ